MASRAAITSRILRQLGLSQTSEARAAIEEAVGTTTKDLLSQNEGRFSGLEEEADLTLAAGATKAKLPNDFNTVLEGYEVNEDGAYIAHLIIKGRADCYADLSENVAASYRKGWIKALHGDDAPDGDGWYLIMSAAPTETKYFLLTFYREATEDDTDLIRNETIVVDGSKGRLPAYVDDAAYRMEIYERRRKGFKEKHRRRIKDRIMLPSAHVARRNQRMNRIARNQR